MAFNFPDAPTIGERWPNPAIAGQPQYQWNGTEWTAAVFDPAGYVKRTGDTMTGALSLSGDPTQALHAVPKQYIDAQRQRISLAGGKSFDVQVPAGASAARLSGAIYMSSAATIVPLLQVSVSPGVFRATPGDYSSSGMQHTSANNTVAAWHNYTGEVGLMICYQHEWNQVPMIFSGTLILKRPNASTSFALSCWANTSTASGINVNMMYSFVQLAATGSALNILAFRLLSNLGNNWAAESYLNIEWL